MKATLQERIAPYLPQESPTMSGAPVKQQPPAVDGDGKNKIDFGALLSNSNATTKREREARKISGGFSGKETEEEFLKKLSEQTSGSKRVPKNVLDKDDFLKLFIAQIQNQDPFNPDDSTEMASKLAHFNSLEQMMNVNKNMEKLIGIQTSSTNLGLTNFIGKEISMQGGRVLLGEEDLSEASFKLGADANNTQVEIRDPSGTIIYEKELNSLLKGEYQLNWDGTNNDGERQPAGLYYFAVTAKDLNDGDIPIEIFTKAKISGVDLKDKEGSIFTNFGKIKLADVISVGDSDYDGKKAAQKIKEEEAPIMPNGVQSPVENKLQQQPIDPSDANKMHQPLIDPADLINVPASSAAAARVNQPVVGSSDLGTTKNDSSAPDQVSEVLRDNPEALAKFQAEMQQHDAKMQQENKDKIEHGRTAGPVREAREQASSGAKPLVTRAENGDQNAKSKKLAKPQRAKAAKPANHPAGKPEQIDSAR